MGVFAVEIADKSISNTWRRSRSSNSPLTRLLQLAQWRHLWPNVTSSGDWLNFWTVSTVAGDERRTDRTNEQIENWTMFQRRHSLIFDLLVCPIRPALQRRGGSAAEWLACWTPAQKGPGSNRVATLSLANCSHTSCLCSPSSKIGSSPLKGCGGNCRPGGKWWQPTARFMTHITCRLTAKNRDQLRNPTLGNRVWATFTFFYHGESDIRFYFAKSISFITSFARTVHHWLSHVVSIVSTTLRTQAASKARKHQAIYFALNSRLVDENSVGKAMYYTTSK